VRAQRCVYRHTCRALRIHISDEIGDARCARTKRPAECGPGISMTTAWSGSSREYESVSLTMLIRQVGKRLIVHSARLCNGHSASLDKVEMSDEQRESLITAMRRFMRVSTTLIRCFPLAEVESNQARRGGGENLGSRRWICRILARSALITSLIS